MPSTKRSKLSNEELGVALKALPEWIKMEEREAIYRRFRFNSFGAAFGFMTRVALMSEKLNHHPDWSNNFNTVDVCLWTQALGGISKLDIELAHFCDGLVR